MKSEKLKRTKQQDSRFEYAVSLAGKINEKLENLNGCVAFYDDEFIGQNVRFSITNSNDTDLDENGQPYREIVLNEIGFSGGFLFGDNNPNYDNGVMWNTKKEIREMFDRVSFYKKLKIV